MPKPHGAEAAIVAVISGRSSSTRTLGWASRIWSSRVVPERESPRERQGQQCPGRHRAPRRRRCPRSCPKPRSGQGLGVGRVRWGQERPVASGSRSRRWHTPLRSPLGVERLAELEPQAVAAGVRPTEAVEPGSDQCRRRYRVPSRRARRDSTRVASTCPGESASAGPRTGRPPLRPRAVRRTRPGCGVDRRGRVEQSGADG